MFWGVSVDCMVRCFNVIVNKGCFTDIEQIPYGLRNRRDGLYCFRFFVVLVVSKDCRL